MKHIKLFEDFEEDFSPETDEFRSEFDDERHVQDEFDDEEFDDEDFRREDEFDDEEFDDEDDFSGDDDDFSDEDDFRSEDEDDFSDEDDFGNEDDDFGHEDDLEPEIHEEDDMRLESKWLRSSQFPKKSKGSLKTLPSRTKKINDLKGRRKK